MVAGLTAKAALVIERTKKRKDCAKRRVIRVACLEEYSLGRESVVSKDCVEATRDVL
jgi:hypothetical protein